MCSTNTTNDSQSDKIKHNYNNHTWFIVVVLFIIAVSIGISAYSSFEYHKNLREIVQFQHESDELVLEKLGGKVIRTVDCHDFAQILASHQDRQESIMQMEYDKLSNEFDILSIWAATITIVFLVFSLYSIFRTDDMLNKAHDSLDQISIYNKNAQQILQSIGSQTDGMIMSVSTRTGEIERRLVELDSRINQMGYDATIVSQSRNELEDVENSSDEETITEES